jgi:hypothetical protein
MRKGKEHFSSKRENRVNSQKFSRLHYDYGVYVFICLLESLLYLLNRNGTTKCSDGIQRITEDWKRSVSLVIGFGFRTLFCTTSSNSISLDVYSYSLPLFLSLSLTLHLCFLRETREAFFAPWCSCSDTLLNLHIHAFLFMRISCIYAPQHISIFL